MAQDHSQAGVVKMSLAQDKSMAWEEKESRVSVQGQSQSQAGGGMTQGVAQGEGQAGCG